jgi:hypothetical protein
VNILVHFHDKQECAPTRGEQLLNEKISIEGWGCGSDGKGPASQL